jgi:hypothetical protein
MHLFLVAIITITIIISSSSSIKSPLEHKVEIVLDSESLPLLLRASLTLPAFVTRAIIHAASDKASCIFEFVEVGGGGGDCQQPTPHE